MGNRVSSISKLKSEKWIIEDSNPIRIDILNHAVMDLGAMMIFRRYWNQIGIRSVSAAQLIQHMS